MDVAGQLTDAFDAIFQGSLPMGLCYAPGRVNLIGEHTDYNGLPVLPMALDERVWIAYRPRTDAVVHLHNLDATFGAAQFVSSADIASSPRGNWENYAKAAIQALNRYYVPPHGIGIDMLVSSTLPEASGLASSSALIVAVALAYADVLGIDLSIDTARLKLAAVLAKGEHYVGTRGGGMDQAVALLAKEGHAAKIDFDPVRVEAVPMFSDHLFVTCHSLVYAHKTVEARDRYNEGPGTCEMIRLLVEHRLRADIDPDLELKRLGDLWFGPLCMRDSEVEELLAQSFPAAIMSLDRIARVLGTTPGLIREQSLNGARPPADGFKVAARARHQRTEYGRVEAARDALLACDAPAFGRLMDASHESCAKDYGISCPELDILARQCREAGALGARLTGAGFGGCVVALIPKSSVESFCKQIRVKYYEGYLEQDLTKLRHYPIRVCSAGSGAGYAFLPQPQGQPGA